MGNSIWDSFGIFRVVYDFDHYFVWQTDQCFSGMADRFLLDTKLIGAVGICHISNAILYRQNISACLSGQFDGGVFRQRKALV